MLKKRGVSPQEQDLLDAENCSTKNKAP
jgi:hypothetical protein